MKNAPGSYPSSQGKDELLDRFFPADGNAQSTPSDTQNGQQDLNKMMGFEPSVADAPTRPEQPNYLDPVGRGQFPAGATSFDEGLEAGYKGLKSGAMYAMGEGLSKLQLPGVGTIGAGSGQQLQQQAREVQASAPQNDDSWGYFLGSLIPSVVPSAAAIAAAPFTGGATLPMAASMGLLSFSSAGNGMMEYEAYKQARGQQVDPMSKLAVGVAYGTFEAAAERFSLGRLMPKGLGSRFFMKGNVEAAERVGRDVLETYRRANPGRFRAITSQIRKGLGAEGIEEVATEIGQAGTDIMYQENDDRLQTIRQLPANMFTAFLGGSIMGAALGPLSYGSQQKVNRDRRRRQGGAVLAQNAQDGNAYELIAPVQNENQRGYQALSPTGEEVFIPQDQIGQVQRLSVDQFNKLLQDKLDTQQFELSNRQPITIATYRGSSVQVKGEDGQGGYYVVGPDGNDIHVPEDQLDNITTLSAEDQFVAEGRELVDQPAVPAEAVSEDGERETPIQDASGDFVYPGDPRYQELRAAQTGQQTDELGVPAENAKRTITVGSGNRKQQVLIEQQPDGTYRVGGRNVVEGGQAVSQQVSELTSDEATSLAGLLRKDFDTRFGEGQFEVRVRPSDQSDPFSPPEIVAFPVHETGFSQEGLGNYEVQAQGSQLRVHNLNSGKDVGPNSPYYLPVIEQWMADNRDALSQMPRLTDTNQNVTQQSFVRDVSSGSDNPVEIAEAYLQARQESGVSAETDPVNVAIAENLVENRFHPSEFNDFGVFFDDSGSQRIIYAQYTSSAAPKDIDVRAQIISQQVGQEVTPEDILEFVKANPGGPQSYMGQQDPIIRELEDRFEEVTSVRLTPKMAEVLTGAREPNVIEGREAPEGEQRAEQVDFEQLNQELNELGVDDAEINRLRQQAESVPEQELEALEAEIEAFEDEAEVLEPEELETRLGELEDFFDRMAAEATEDATEEITEAPAEAQQEQTGSTPQAEGQAEPEQTESEPEAPQAEEQEGPVRGEVNSTQFNVPDQGFTEFAQSIPESELYTEEEGFGREMEPHVTALFGIESEVDPEQVQELVQDNGSVELEFGETFVFENDNYDVLAVEVLGDDVHRLHDRLTENLPYENNFPDYRPHLTIAYLKSGQGQKYAGDDRFVGQTVQMDQLLFSATDQTKTPIPLTGAPFPRAFDYLTGEGQRVKSTNGDITIAKTRSSNFEIRVPGSTRDGRKYFGNKQLQQLVRHNEFERYGGTYNAEILPSNLLSVLDLLKEEYNMTVELPKNALRLRRAGETGGTDDLLDAQTSAHAIRLADGLRQRISGWAGSDRIVIAESPEQLPQEVRDLLSLQAGRIGGLYHNGISYVLTYNLNSQKEADLTLAHEVIGHMGIRGLIGHVATNQRDYQRRMKELTDQVYSSFKDTPEFADIVSQDGLDMRRSDHRQEAAEEFIANLAETDPNSSIIDKFVKLINDLLRELGLSQQITRADVKAMIADARQFVERGTPTAVDEGGRLLRPVFSKSALAPIYYGKLNNAIASDLNNKGTPEQFKKTLQAWNKKGRFKTEELEWSGVIEWLDGIGEGPVYKEQVMDFLEANQIEIQESMLSGRESTFHPLNRNNIVNLLIEESGWDESAAEQAVAAAEEGDTDAIDELEMAGIPDEYLELFNRESLTKYADHTLPGGQNYRELLIHFTGDYDAAFSEAEKRLNLEAQSRFNKDFDDLPVVKKEFIRGNIPLPYLPTYKSQHFGEAGINLLAHVRFNERVDSDGNRVLFLEEIQSDWHQDGREYGYRGLSTEELRQEERDLFQKLSDRIRSHDNLGFDSTVRALNFMVENEDWGYQYDLENMEDFDPEDLNQIEQDLERYRDVREPSVLGKNTVPDAPFKTTWHELVIKRMLRYGTEHNFDKVAWTTGEQQIERYDLSKQVREIVYYPKTKKLMAYSIQGPEIPMPGEVTPAKLSDYVGKEMADKIMEKHDQTGGDKVVMRGADLQVGGEGMRVFYNQMIPRFVSKYTRKWGAEVAPITIITGNAPQEVLDQHQDNEAFQQANRQQVLAVDITPQMRESVLTVGQPLFSRLGNDYQAFEEGIDQYFSGDLESHIMLDIGNPSEVLRQAGIPDVPIVITQSVLRKASATYGFPDEYVRDIPRLVNQPVMIFRSKFGEGRKVIMTEATMDDQTGVVALQLEDTRRGMVIHDIRSFHPKDAEKIGFWIQDGYLSYADKEKALGWIEAAGESNSLRDLNPQGLINKINETVEDFNSGQTRFRRFDPLQDTPHQWQRRRDRAVRLFQDQMIDVFRIQQGVVDEGGTLTDESNTYTAENRSSGIIEAQQEDFQSELVDPLKEEARRLNREKGVTYEDINQFLKARHAPERNAYFLDRNPEEGDAQSGMTDEDAAGIMEDLENRGIREDLEQLAVYVDGMTDFILRNQVETGLISGERYGSLRKQYQYYVPLRGFAEHMGVDPTVFSGDMRAEGRQSEAGDPLPYLAAMADTAIVAGQKNVVIQHLLEFVKKNWERSDLFRIRNVFFRATGEVDPQTGKAEYEPTFTQPTADDLLSGRVKRNLDYETETALWNSQASPFNEASSIRVLVKGRPVVIEFTTPHIAQALKKTNVSDMGWVTSQIAKATTFLRHVITQYSPEFGARNLFRDSMTGYINLSIDFDTPTAASIVNPAQIARGFAALRRGVRFGEFDGEWGKAFNEFRQIGGMTGWWNLDEVRQRARDLQEAVEGGGPSTWTREHFNSLLGWLDDYNRVVENIIRVSTYKHLTENSVINPNTGKAFTKKQAADYAKDLTVNFNRKGSESGIIGSWFIFFNAAGQGIARQASPFFSGDSRRVWRAAATPMVMSAMSFALIEAMRYGLGKDDDDEYYYDKINEWTRTHNIMLPNLLSEDPEDFLKIPMAYGYNVYWAVGDMLSRAVYGSVSPQDAALELVATAIDAYNPIGTAEGDTPLETLGRTFTPTIGKPVVEIISNKDFAGNPITPEPFPFAPTSPQSQQYFPWTPEYIVELSQFMNRISGGDEVTKGLVDISPEHLEYVLDYVGGGAGRFVSGLVNTEENLRKYMAGERELELFDIYDVPFARAHYGRVPTGAGADRFRERRDEIEDLTHRYEHYHETGQMDKADRLWTENEHKLLLEPDMRAVANQISSLYDWMRIIEAEPNTPENREEIRNIEETIRSLYNGFNLRWNQGEGGTREPVSQQAFESLDNLIFNGSE